MLFWGKETQGYSFLRSQTELTSLLFMKSLDHESPLYFLLLNFCAVDNASSFEKQTVEGISAIKYEPAEFLKDSTDIICRVPLKQD